MKQTSAKNANEIVFNMNGYQGFCFSLACMS